MKRILPLLLCVIHFSTFAQGKKIDIVFENVGFTQVLTHLEKEFDLKFSYNVQLVENKKITISGRKLDKNEVFRIIEQQVPIVFKKISKRYYIVKQKPITDFTISVSGYVKVKGSGESLPGAEVIERTKYIGTSTDTSGYFKLDNLHVWDTVQIRYLGFVTRLIPVKEFSENLLILMEEDVHSLGEVLVREYLTSGIGRNENGSFSIKPKILGILPGLTEPDVFESLQMLPGIQSPNENASGLHIRGGSPDQNLILWDGIKVYHSGHLFGAISAINPYVTNEIQVLKSGVNARFGNCISGVIDLDSGKDIPQKVEGGFGFNMTHSDLFLKTPLANKKLGVVVSFRRSYNDILGTFTERSLTKKTFQDTRKMYNEDGSDNVPLTNDVSFYYTDFSIKTIAQLSSRDQLTFSNLTLQNKLNYKTNDTILDDSSKDYLKITNLGFHVTWQRKWSERFNHQLKLSSSKYDFDYNGGLRFEGEQYASTLKKNNIKDVNAELFSNYKISNEQNLFFGYQYGYYNTSFHIIANEYLYPENSYNISDETYDHIHSFFIEYQINKSEKFFFNGGVRLNQLNKRGELFLEPRLHAELTLSRDLRFKLSGDIKNQSISQIIEYDTSDFGLENQLWTLSDGDVYPFLRSKQIGVGLIYNRNGWQFDIESYYKKVKGLTSLTRGFSNDYDNFSYGENAIYGLDFLVKKRIRNYRTWLSYSISKSDFKFPDIKGENWFPGNFDMRHNLTIANTYRYQNFEFSLGWRFHTGKPYSKIELNQSDNHSGIESNQINNKRLSAYHRLDFSSTYEFRFSKSNQSKAKIGFSLLNIYNRKNVLNTSYFIIGNPDSSDEKLIENKTISLRFTPNFSFRYSF
ncbi:carboxypeptidase-like regulatory domain-containing protein [Marinifilum flexuosum]|uniref:carboxypeptidase-like regulatory domain-containing protein n=1 Tax=Marinifilum flexuosum TaxID=1117708 RepID=UPI00249519F5|nr:carboxypeptidase-like regulatory domain-containing protein [Marinifilum flexuosum]